MKSHVQPPHLSPVRATVRVLVLLVMPMLALLGLGRLAVELAPVTVEIVGDRTGLRLTIDGTSRRIELDHPAVAARLVGPIAFRREHQIDGSDSTNMLTFNARYFGEMGLTPYYQLQAFLREEWRYSTWRRLEVADGFERPVVELDWPPNDLEMNLPTPFRLTLDLERPEITRTIELTDANFQRLYVDVNRNDKIVRVGSARTRDVTDLTFWYFPREILPPLATLLDLFARALALALGLVLVVGALALVMPARLTWLPGPKALRLALPVGLAALLGASGYVAFALFDRAPHILDAIAYVFQAKTFAAGALWLPPPPIDDAFPIPFSVVHEGRWFAQYPPGTAALLALGVLARVPWLIEPLLAAGAVWLVVLTARRQYGPGTALLVLVLLVTSPFLLLNAGSYLSHVPAMFFGCIALYCATRYSERPAPGWAALAALGLGLALLTREVVAVLYGLALLGTVAPRAASLRGRALTLDVLASGLVLLAALGAYLGYNALITGNPLILPRALFNSGDVLGFGKGIGFYGEHTVASGLVNAEQQLVSLGFSLAGWPYGFSLALILLPIVTRRVGGWDATHLLLAVLYVLLYVAEFYHGIAFGPRYYFEMLPSLTVLTARGFTALTDRIGGWLDAVGRDGGRGGGPSSRPRPGWRRARLATAVLAVALFACNALYFLPRQATLYGNFTGIPGGGPSLDRSVIGHDLAGRTSRLSNALVVADEWWIFTMYFASLNCPRLDCPTVFALAREPEEREDLARAFPGRDWYEVTLRDGVLTVVPGRP